MNIKHRKWTEEEIREELKRLDQQTGLNGSALPIIFTKEKSVLGKFHCVKGEECFYFSRFYFGNPEYCDEELIDTIRHEYSHYMNFVLYGNTGHGVTWKRCCLVTGAMPKRCFDEGKHKRIMAGKCYYDEKEKLAVNFSVGARIYHPEYGRGVIRERAGTLLVGRLTVQFEREEKEMNLCWAVKHCTIIDENDQKD